MNSIQKNRVKDQIFKYWGIFCTAIGLVLWPDLFETRDVYMYVDDGAQTLIDESRDPNCKIATDIDVDEFSRRLMDLYMKQDYKR